jgi:hypothetical protein
MYIALYIWVGVLLLGIWRSLPHKKPKDPPPQETLYITLCKEALSEAQAILKRGSCWRVVETIDQLNQGRSLLRIGLVPAEEGSDAEVVWVSFDWQAENCHPDLPLDAQKGEAVTISLASEGAMLQEPGLGAAACLRLTFLRPRIDVSV